MRKIKRIAIAIMVCMALTIGVINPMNTERVEASFVDASAGQLHVDGTVLKDSKGNIVQLRGVSTHGLSWFPQYVNNAFFKELHDTWRANTVRLAMYTAEYNGYCTGDDNNKKSLKKLIKDGVGYAKANNMYAIVDWHILSDSNPNTNIEEAKKFWDEMSKEFASNTNVLYEICNEPNGGTSWSDIKKYAETIIPIIRKNDSDSVIIVGTPTWSQEVDKAAADPLKYNNVMYTLHFYADTHKQDLRDKADKAIKAGLPIFVTEFGICDASGNGTNNKTEGNNWISFLDKNNVSYVAWNLANKDESSSLISSSCSKTSGIKKSDLSDSGQWYYDVLTKKAVAKDGLADNYNDNGTEVKNEESNTENSNTENSAENNDSVSNNGKKCACITVKHKSFSVKKKNLKNKSKLFCLKAKCNSGGKLSFKKVSGSKYLSVTKKGKVKVKANTPKGTYKIKIGIKSKAKGSYKASKKTLTVKVKVK